MNKKLVTLAVAAALVVPAAAMAEATLYGKIQISLDYLDFEDGYDGWDMASRASRLGVKGSEDLGNGLKAIYQIEMDIPIVDSAGTVFDGDRGRIGMRNTFAGLSSQWGTLLAGRHDTPFKVAGGKLDMFADTLADFNQIVGFEDLRADSTVMYISPSFSGFQFAAAIVPSGGVTGQSYTKVEKIGWTDYDKHSHDVYAWTPWGKKWIGFTDKDGHKHDVYGKVSSTSNPDADGLAEAWSAAAIYSNGPFYGTVAYETMSGNLLGPSGSDADDYDKWRVGLGLLDWNGFTLSGVYENWSSYWGWKDADADLWQVQAGYAFGNNQVKAAYGQLDPDGGSKSDSWAVGFDHNFSKRTKAYVLYTDVEAGVASGSDWDGISLGMVHAF